jgi:hypothetical protein
MIMYFLFLETRSGSCEWLGQETPPQQGEGFKIVSWCYCHDYVLSLFGDPFRVVRVAGSGDPATTSDEKIEGLAANLLPGTRAKPRVYLDYIMIKIVWGKAPQMGSLSFVFPKHGKPF